MPTRLSVEDAAHALGVSQDTVKRRLKRGTLRGEQAPTPSGFRWLVLLDDPAMADATASAVATGVAGATAGTADATADAMADRMSDTPPQDAPAPTTMALETVRAAGMAQYTRELLEPLHGRLEAQAERIGRLEQEVEHLRAQLVEATTNGQAETQRDAVPEQGRRRWWARLWGQLAAG